MNICSIFHMKGKKICTIDKTCFRLYHINPNNFRIKFSKIVCSTLCVHTHNDPFPLSDSNRDSESDNNISSMGTNVKLCIYYVIA